LPVRHKNTQKTWRNQVERFITKLDYGVGLGT
jgi:hypothetical protein